MAREIAVVCDCCGYRIVNGSYIVAKRRWMKDWRDTGNVRKFLVCSNCLHEICKRVEANRKMEFDVEVSNGR